MSGLRRLAVGVERGCRVGDSTSSINGAGRTPWVSIALGRPVWSEDWMGVVSSKSPLEKMGETGRKPGGTGLYVGDDTRGKFAIISPTGSSLIPRIGDSGEKVGDVGANDEDDMTA